MTRESSKNIDGTLTYNFYDDNYVCLASVMPLAETPSDTRFLVWLRSGREKLFPSKRAAFAFVKASA